MAKSSTTKGKSPVPISTGTAVAEPPAEETPDTSVVPETPEPPQPPAEAAQPAPPPKTLTFFERMGRIHKDDWGPRANIYLYRTEPMIDRTRGGEKKYVQCYAEPIGEERILVDHGSGRYKAVLNFKKPGAERGDEIDAHFFDLLNLAFPPKVPDGDWVDDPKNKKWAWARKAPAPAAPAPIPMSGLAEAASTLETLVNISDRMSEKNKPATPPQQPAAPTPVDPWTAAEKILNMRSDNPMVEMMKSQMELQAKAIEAERERQFKAAEAARQREHELQQKLMEAKATPAAAQSKGWLEQLIDFGGETMKTRIVNGLFGNAGSTAAETVTRSGRTSGLDVVQNLGRDFFQSDFSRDVGRWLGSLAERNMAQAQSINPANGHQPQQTQQQLSGDPFQRFVVEIVNPKMLMFFNDEPNAEGGEAFADWLWAGFPEHFERLQNFEHPRLPGLKGAAAILTGYRNTPNIWNQVRPERETGFAEFVNAFCGWKPPGDEPVEDAEVVTESGAVDFDAQEGRPS